MVEIGKKLKELREKKGLTVLQLSYAAKVSSNYIHRIEQKNKNVSIKTLYKLSTALGVHITDLFPLKNKKEAA